MLEKLKKYVNSHEKQMNINTLKNEIESLKDIIIEKEYEIKKLKSIIKKYRKEGKNEKK